MALLTGNASLCLQKNTWQFTVALTDQAIWYFLELEIWFGFLSGEKTRNANQIKTSWFLQAAPVMPCLWKSKQLTRGWGVNACSGTGKDLVGSWSCAAPCAIYSFYCLEASGRHPQTSLMSFKPLSMCKSYHLIYHLFSTQFRWEDSFN